MNDSQELNDLNLALRAEPLPKNFIPSHIITYGNDKKGRIVEYKYNVVTKRTSKRIIATPIVKREMKKQLKQLLKLFASEE